MTDERRLPKPFDAYLASADGIIYEHKTPGEQRELPTSGEPYKQVSLRGADGNRVRSYVHRVVALAFHGEPPTLAHEVAHKDGDKHNNRADNLRWATKRENNIDRVRHGGGNHGARNGGAKLSQENVDTIRAVAATKACTQTAIAKRFGVSASCVSAILSGKRWAYDPETMNARLIAAIESHGAERAADILNAAPGPLIGKRVSAFRGHNTPPHVGIVTHSYGNRIVIDGQNEYHESACELADEEETTDHQVAT